MIGNFSFEEHVRYFTKMYDLLKSIDQDLDDATIINFIKSKVMIEQVQENTMHNINIKNIHNTPMVKDFKIWIAKYETQSEDEDEEESEDEREDESEYENGYPTNGPTTNGEDINDYSALEEFRRNYRNSANQNYNFIPSIFDIPEDH